MSADPHGSQRLTTMLIRLPPQMADELRSLSRATRVRQSDYLREAVRDLLAKYGRDEERLLRRKAG